MTGSASRPNRTEKEIRFAERKIRPDGFGSTLTRPGRNLTRTFPKTEPKFGLQNLPNVLAVGLFWRNDLGCASVFPSEQTSSSYIILYV